MKITFIRNSKIEINIKTPIKRWSLGDEGVERGVELSRINVIRNIDVIYTSLDNASLETAVLLAKAHGTEIKTNNNLTEISSLTDKFFEKEDYDKNIELLFSGEIARVEEGESLQEALSRFSAALENIVFSEAKNSKITNIGIVGHGAILAYFCCQFCEKSPFELYDSMKSPDVAVYDWNSEKFDVMFGEIV